MWNPLFLLVQNPYPMLSVIAHWSSVMLSPPRNRHMTQVLLMRPGTLLEILAGTRGTVGTPSLFLWMQYWSVVTTSTQKWNNSAWKWSPQRGQEYQRERERKSILKTYIPGSSCTWSTHSHWIYWLYKPYYFVYACLSLVSETCNLKNFRI